MALFGVGKVCLAAWPWGAGLILLSLACAAYLYKEAFRQA
jgi:hypothetical protein